MIIYIDYIINDIIISTNIMEEFINNADLRQSLFTHQGIIQEISKDLLTKLITQRTITLFDRRGCRIGMVEIQTKDIHPVEYQYSMDNPERIGFVFRCALDNDAGKNIFKNYLTYLEEHPVYIVYAYIHGLDEGEQAECFFGGITHDPKQYSIPGREWTKIASVK